MPTKKKAEKEKHTALKAGGIFQTRANATAHRKHKNDQHELKLHFSQATHTKMDGMAEKGPVVDVELP